MKIENGKIVRKKRNSFSGSVVKGVRADSEFWTMCDNVANGENTSRNELIVRVVAQYCERKEYR